MAAAVHERNGNQRYRRKGNAKGSSAKKIEKPKGHILYPPEGLPCVNERETGECKQTECKGTHDYKGWKDNECTNPCYMKFKICPKYLPRRVDRKIDESFCKHKHKERPNYKLLNKYKLEAKKHYAHMFAICQDCEPNTDEDDHFYIDSTTSSPRYGYISGMVEETTMSSHMHIGSTHVNCDMSSHMSSPKHTMDEITAVLTIPDNAKILFDGGTFAHMYGTGVHQLLGNRRTLPYPKTIMTAAGISTVYEMTDLYIGDYALLNGYVNDSMPTLGRPVSP